jgi:hypothetical protein
MADMDMLCRFGVSFVFSTIQNVLEYNFVVAWIISESLPTTAERTRKKSRKDSSACSTLLWLFRRRQKTNRVGWWQLKLAGRADLLGSTSLAQGHNSRRTVEERQNVEKYQKDLQDLQENLKKQTAHLEDARQTVKQAEEAVDRANAETLKPTENISLADIQKFVEKNNPALAGRLITDASKLLLTP